MRAVCTSKAFEDKLVLAAQGILNMASGTLGVVSGLAGLAGDSATNTSTGIGSLVAWEWVEAINVLANYQQALADLRECNVTYTLASVLCSCLKILGGGSMAIAGALASQPLLIIGMVFAGAGTVGSVITGAVKLVNICRERDRRIQNPDGPAPEAVVFHSDPNAGSQIESKADSKAESKRAPKVVPDSKDERTPDLDSGHWVIDMPSIDKPAVSATTTGETQKA
jgi:hypothetical protein